MAKYLGRPPLMLQSYQNESKSGKTFIDLPTEIIQNIISRVDGVSALAVRATCKTLRNQVDYLSTTDLHQLQTAFIPKKNADMDDFVALLNNRANPEAHKIDTTATIARPEAHIVDSHIHHITSQLENLNEK